MVHTMTPSYHENEAFQKPADENVRIWRYIDFAKFVSMLDSRTLFFARADKLGDPFEGSYSKLNIKLRKEIYDKIPEHKLKELSVVREKLKRFILINCWSMGDCESDVLWKYYLKSEYGVAVQSTFKRLAESFGKRMQAQNDCVFIGTVEYTDYETQWIPERNFFYPFLNKRRNFVYENELRAIIKGIPEKTNPAGELQADLESDICEVGIFVPVDLNILIEKIVVSPLAQVWFNDLVKSIMTKYGLDKEVLPSALVGTPVY